MSSGAYHVKVKIGNYNEEQWDQQFAKKEAPPRLLGLQHNTYQTTYSTEHSIHNSLDRRKVENLTRSVNVNSLKLRESSKVTDDNQQVFSKAFPGHQPELDHNNKQVLNQERSNEEAYYRSTSAATYSNPRNSPIPKETLTYLPPNQLNEYRKTWTSKQARDMHSEYQREHGSVADKRTAEYNKR
ncbi:hypothetical protein NAEGRDRAFT_78582 [Naegleria gruberi]|uniref:Uncharacterized protein n=1 Tax=Naegleria gruberi TaxID=5762 RepID=D2V4N9_NAEGR|nr:uncharacterized protein NAEGRDRAFT_78582 [Naegleria gruberi]EFC47964.1 hypothetical protein NAEGRDRAFT_78582 [Naegleria gruberi]|eukprot:XP_002680708.1 hypothetical protein NAEGRDRAFT_78582 [Naegleria gruberi strain NEG-M]